MPATSPQPCGPPGAPYMVPGVCWVSELNETKPWDPLHGDRTSRGTACPGQTPGAMPTHLNVERGPSPCHLVWPGCSCTRWRRVCVPRGACVGGSHGSGPKPLPAETCLRFPPSAVARTRRFVHLSLTQWSWPSLPATSSLRGHMGSGTRPPSFLKLWPDRPGGDGEPHPRRFLLFSGDSGMRFCMALCFVGDVMIPCSCSKQHTGADPRMAPH